MASGLGKNQKHWLKAVAQVSPHGWYPGCGQVWANRSDSVALCESLVRRGLMAKEGTRPTYKLTDAGWAASGVPKPKSLG